MPNLLPQIYLGILCDDTSKFLMDVFPKIAYHNRKYPALHFIFFEPAEKNSTQTSIEDIPEEIRNLFSFQFLNV